MVVGALSDSAGHVKAGPGDFALHGGAGFFLGEISDVVVGVGRIHQAIDGAGDVKINVDYCPQQKPAKNKFDRIESNRQS